MCHQNTRLHACKSTEVYCINGNAFNQQKNNLHFKTALSKITVLGEIRI